MSSTFSTRRFDSTGVSLFAVEAGQGPLVVFMHGLTANAYVWEPVLLRLALRCHVVALDQRGHGRSDKPTGDVYTDEHFAADLSAVVAQAGGRAVVVGHSLGARNAQVAAWRYPSQIAAILAIDFTPYVEAKVFDALDSRIAKGFETFTSWPEVTRYLSARFPTLSAEAIDRRAQYGYVANGTNIGPLAVKAAIVATCRGLRKDLSGPLRELKVPASFVCGGDSWVVSAQAVAATRALRPDLPVTVVEGASHYVHEEQPEFVATAVAKLLDKYC